jgi:polyphosphate glucokinase
MFRSLVLEEEEAFMKKKPTRPQLSSKGVRTLAVDIGGTGIKAIVLDGKGFPLTERHRIPTPQPATPGAVVKVIQKLAKSQGTFDRVSVGFPGVIRRGVVSTAPNLDPSWGGYCLTETLCKRLGKPVRSANDADVQGFGAIQGQGVELVVTLGTGFGSALFVDGHLVPNLEIAHHPFRSQYTYEDELGVAALRKIGKKKWNQRLAKAFQSLEALINYDVLYIGGGNAKKLSISLAPNQKVIPNIAGLLGGIAFWNMDNPETAKATRTPKSSRRGNSKGQQKKRSSSKKTST